MQHTSPSLQQPALTKSKATYQKYLNNIYQTIKEKQFYIHRSKTPNIDIVNPHEVSKLSQRSACERKQEGLKSLPKLSVKDTLGDVLLDAAVLIDTQPKLQSRVSSPIKKPSSSSKQKNPLCASPTLQSDKNIYQFGNFPQPRPSIASHVYVSAALRESKELSRNSTIARQKMLKETKGAQSFKGQISGREKRPSNENPSSSPTTTPNTKLSLYKKISKDNMNLLGLNVQKVNYSQKQKKEPPSSSSTTNPTNRRLMFMKLTKAQEIELGIQISRNQRGQGEEGSEDVVDGNVGQIVVGREVYEEQNGQSEQNQYTVGYFDTSRNSNVVDIDLCEQLISQKMQFSKRQSIPNHNQRKTLFSPNRRRVSASHKQPKPLPPDQPQQLNPIYFTRYKKYLDLMLKLAFSYKRYAEMDPEINPASHVQIRNDKKYKAWVGNGNNGNLLKALIKRRYWWQVVEEKTWGVNFLWTQLKNNEYFKAQGDKKLKTKALLPTKCDKEMQSSTNMDESTCLSLDNEKISQKKLSSIKKTRAQSSMPGNIGSTRKQLISPTKKPRPPVISEEEMKIMTRLMNRQEMAQYKKLAPRLQGKTFAQKLQILEIQKFNPSQCRTHNHLMNNFYLGNKKALFHNLKEYYSLAGGDLFKTVPLTFHIKKGLKDPQYKRFLAYYKKRQSYMKKQEREMEMGVEEKRKMRNIWIVKPGENTNRGNGITVIDEVYQLNSIFKQEGTHGDGEKKTFIVQLYIDRPLLYKKRKFDIRHYMLITHIHGVMKGYWFQQGYIRTSGYQFDIQNLQRQIHLTNDAVQKWTPNYGRFQPANKISYAEFQKYLDQTYPKKGYDFYGEILPRMKEICLDAIKSACLKLSPEKLEHNFELFGMDFMIDSDFVPWLIEINTNPCLQITNPLQSRLLPQVLDQSLRLTLDVIYPPPCHYPNTYRHLVPQTSNPKAELIFDQTIDGQQIMKLYQKRKTNEKALLEEIGELEDDEVYEEEEGEKDFKLEEGLL